ncbi:MAG: hypothetical protein GY952_12205, partial [Rhodobacteraceae bacterium]|nr:hypothetical protein [Paracoccaceae bacterium]
MLGRLLLPLVFAAIPAVAQSVIPVEPERVDEFIDVLAGHDCRMSQDASEALLSAAGFPDRQEVKGIVSRLFYYDRARIQDDHLTVYFGPCPEGPETGVKTLFLQSVSANGCQMSASDSMDI